MKIGTTSASFVPLQRSNGILSILALYNSLLTLYSFYIKLLKSEWHDHVIGQYLYICRTLPSVRVPNTVIILY